MCGLVGLVSKRNVVSILVNSLKKLEYRGYDSAGVAVVDEKDNIQLVRTVGKVNNLENVLQTSPLKGQVGIAHTRWATHGEPAEYNAHPQVSSSLAVVHNGIIENYSELKSFLQKNDYKFVSETDTEVIAHLIDYYYSKEKDLVKAIRSASKDFEGAYALGIVSKEEPNKIYAIRHGSPLVAGIGAEENYIASDTLAISQNVENIYYLSESDLAVISETGIEIFDENDQPVERELHSIDEEEIDVVQKGKFKHYMLKEIFEQPKSIKDTLEGRFNNNKVLVESFGYNIKKLLEKSQNVYIVACGTSFHAGLIAKYWIESLAKIPCTVEIASEFKYRDVALNPNSLFLTISQSGETADTIAALRKSKTMPFLSRITICNVANSTLVRESEGHLLTRAGVEIGVASTKAFITQLTVLLLLALGFVSVRKNINLLSDHDWDDLILGIDSILDHSNQIRDLAEDFVDKQSTLFLGRGAQYPLAMEGALKLKEISYIHAESYAAGELKHGPLALVDKVLPVVFIAPDDHLLKKVKSNLSEIHSRGGNLYVVTNSLNLQEDERYKCISVPTVKDILTPILYSIPLQLLSYYVAVLKGTDVDQPRNLAKSVTVE